MSKHYLDYLTMSLIQCSGDFPDSLSSHLNCRMSLEMFLVDSVRPIVNGGLPTIQHFDIIRWRNRGLGKYPLREVNHSKWHCSRSSEGTLRQITLTAGVNLIRWTSCKLWKAATSGPLLQRNCWVKPTRWIGWTNKSSFCQVLFKVGVLLRMTENFDFFRFFYRFFFAGINYLKIIDAHFFLCMSELNFFSLQKKQVKIIWTHFTSQFVTIRELFSVTFFAIFSVTLTHSRNLTDFAVLYIRLLVALPRHP